MMNKKTYPTPSKYGLSAANPIATRSIVSSSSVRNMLSITLLDSS